MDQGEEAGGRKRKNAKKEKEKKTGVCDKPPVASSEQNISGSQTGGPGRISSGVWETNFKPFN